MFKERVDLSNDVTWRQMIAVGVRRVVLARGELDKLARTRDQNMPRGPPRPEQKEFYNKTPSHNTGHGTGAHWH